MGVYGVLPNVAVALRNMSAESTLLLVFYGPPAQGTLRVTLELRTDKGARLQSKVIPETFEVTPQADWGSIILAFRVTTIYPSAGTYSVVLSESGKEVFRDTFKIVPAPTP
jgi:hypothetical protein